MNSGYDTKDGDYIVVWHEAIAYRYEVVDRVGKGSFGAVLKCFDHKVKEFVALKIIWNKPRLHK